MTVNVKALPCITQYQAVKIVKVYLLVFIMTKMREDMIFVIIKMTKKGKFFVMICLEDVFRFAEHRKNTTYRLGYNLMMQ